MTELPVTIFLAVLIGAQIGYLGASRAQMSTKRFFTIAAVEPRGGVTVGQEPFPSEPLPSGGGYVVRPPDSAGRWEVSTYLWTPSQIVVSQGDVVTLEFVGINGAAHPTEIRGLAKSFTLKRGHVIRVEFRADEPGIHPVICSAHQPSMRAEIVVLPRA